MFSSLETFQWTSGCYQMAEMESGLNFWRLTRPSPDVCDPLTRPSQFDRSRVSAKSSKLRVPNLHYSCTDSRWHNDPTRPNLLTRWPLIRFHLCEMVLILFKQHRKCCNIFIGACTKYFVSFLKILLGSSGLCKPCWERAANSGELRKWLR